MAAKTKHEFVLVGTDKASKVMKGVSKSTGGLLDTTFKLTNTISASIVIAEKFAGAIGKVGSSIGKTVGVFAEFEKGMAEVGTITSFTSTELEDLGKHVSRFSGEYAVDAADATKALYQAISAGVDQDAALFFLEDAAKLATGGVMGTASAVDILTSVVNAYGMDVEDVTKVSDILFTTVKMGVTTGEELAASLGQVTPIAAGAGVSFEDLSAAMAVLTKGGLSTAEATTSLKALLTSIVSPTTQASEAIAELGLTAFSEAGLREKGGIFKALQQLVEQSDGTVESLTAVIPNVRALTGALSISGQMDQIPEVLDAMANSAGATEEAFGKMTKTFDFQQERLSKTFTGLITEMGRVIAVNPQVQAGIGQLTESLAELTGGLAEGDGAMSDIAVAFQEAVSAAIPLLIEAVAYLADSFAGNTGLSHSLDVVGRILTLLQTSILNVVNSFQILWRVIKLVAASAALNGSEMRKLTGEIKDLGLEVANRSVDAFEDLTGEWKQGSETAGILAERLREMAEKVREVADVAPEAETGVEELKLEVVELGVAATAAAVEVDNLVTSLDVVAKVDLGQLNRETFVYLDALKRDLPEVSLAWTKLYLDLKENIKDLPFEEQAAEMQKFHDAVKGTFDRAVGGSAEAAAGMNQYSVSAEEAAKAVEKLGDKAADAPKRGSEGFEKLAGDAAVAGTKAVEEWRRSAESIGNNISTSLSTAFQDALSGSATLFDGLSSFTNTLKASFSSALLDPIMGAGSPLAALFSAAISPVAMLGSAISEKIFLPMVEGLLAYFGVKKTAEVADGISSAGVATATAATITGTQMGAVALMMPGLATAATLALVASFGGASFAAGLLPAIIGMATAQGQAAAAMSMVGFADGGFVDSAQVAMVGEGNKPEVIIPLSKPDRARQLLAETFERHPDLFLSAMGGKGGVSSGGFGGTNNFTITVNGAGDPSRTSAAIVNKIDQMLGMKLRGRI